MTDSPQAAPYFLVLGYGTGGSLRYLAYLDRVAAAYQAMQPAWVVLTGGVTGKPDTALSEAEWMARRLESRGVPRHCLRLEEISHTTLENFLCARDLGLLAGDRQAVVFCDTYRLLKVWSLARRLRLDVQRYVHLPIESRPWGAAACFRSLFDATRWLLFGLPGNRRAAEPRRS